MVATLVHWCMELKCGEKHKGCLYNFLYLLYRLVNTVNVVYSNYSAYV